MNMSCKDWEERVSAFADDALGQEHQAGLFAHLAGCVGCRDFLAGIRRVKAASKEDEVDFPAGLDERVLTAIAAQKEAEEKRALWTRPPWRRSVAVPAPLAYALGLVLVLLIGLVVWEEFNGRGALLPDVLKPVAVVSCYEMPEIEVLSPSLGNRGQVPSSIESRPDQGAGMTLLIPGERDRPPQWVSQPEVAYPEWMDRRGLGGRVAFVALVDDRGRIARIQPEYPADEYSDLARAALPAIKELQFTPALRQGSPAEAWIRITVFFKSEESEIYRTIERIFT
jgi:TonB family protein